MKLLLLSLLLSSFSFADAQGDKDICFTGDKSEVGPVKFIDFIKTKKANLIVEVEKNSSQSNEQTHLLVKAKIDWEEVQIAAPADVSEIMSSIQEEIKTEEAKAELFEKNIIWNVVGFKEIQDDAKLNELQQINSDMKRSDFIIDKEKLKEAKEKKESQISFFVEKKEEPYEIVVQFSSEGVNKLAKRITIPAFESKFKLVAEAIEDPNQKQSLFKVKFSDAVDIESIDLSEVGISFQGCPKDLDCDDEAKIKKSQDNKSLIVSVPKHLYKTYKAKIFFHKKDALIEDNILEVKPKKDLRLNIASDWKIEKTNVLAKLNVENIDGDFNWYCKLKNKDEKTEFTVEQMLESPCSEEMAKELSAKKSSESIQIKNKNNKHYFVMANFKSDDDVNINSKILRLKRAEVELALSADDNQTISYSLMYKGKAVDKENYNLEISCSFLPSHLEKDKIEEEAESNQTAEKDSKEEEETESEQTALKDSKEETNSSDKKIASSEESDSLDEIVIEEQSEEFGCVPSLDKENRKITILIRPDDLKVNIIAKMLEPELQTMKEIEIGKGDEAEFIIESEKLKLAQSANSSQSEEEISQSNEEIKKSDSDPLIFNSAKIKIGDKEINLIADGKKPQLNFYDNQDNKITNEDEIESLNEFVSVDDGKIIVNRPESGDEGFSFGFSYGGVESQRHKVEPKKGFDLQLKKLSMDQIASWNDYNTQLPLDASEEPSLGEEEISNDDDINGETISAIEDDEKAQPSLAQDSFGYCAFQVVDGSSPIIIEESLIGEDGYNYKSDGWHFNVSGCVSAKKYTEKWDESLASDAQLRHVYICKVPKKDFSPIKIEAKLTLEGNTKKNQTASCTIPPNKVLPGPYKGDPAQQLSAGPSFPQPSNFTPLPRIHLGLNLI